MAQIKKFGELSEPNIKKILEAGRIESELDHERLLLADRELMHQEQLQPDLRATRRAISNMIVAYEAKYWSDEKCVTDAQVEESDAAEIQAAKEYAFIWRRQKLILGKLQEFSLKQRDLALLLNHSKSYTSELLSGIRPFSTNDLKLIHILFQIPLSDLIINVPSQETLSRLGDAIDQISSTNPKAHLLRSALAAHSAAGDLPPEHAAEIEPDPVRYDASELSLSNK